MAEGRDGRQKGRTSTKYVAKKAATERIAIARAAEVRAVRRRNIMVAGGATLAVLAVVVTIVGLGLSQKKSAAKANPVVPASSTVTAGLAAAAALMTQPSTLSDVTKPPSRLTGAALNGPAGTPQVLYVGAEYCPFCAVTRWPLAVALSRFGTFSNLKTTLSSPTDTNPNTPTLSFHGATYTSSYIDFVGVEAQDGAGKPLQQLTPAQSTLFQTLGGGSYPFIDFGGKWMQSGADTSASVLAGMTPDAVATAITDPKSKVGASVQAGADVFTAVICNIDGGKPANVCTAAGVTAAQTEISAIK
ncbi:MAG: hypothetical protein QOJ62_308 [Actinomycetota bacterium]|nr:hypothetical protein [Actinomycetota bacterium]